MRLAPLLLAAGLTLRLNATAWAQAVEPPATITADTPAVRQEFMQALQGVRTHEPDGPDSAALTAYPIYDYLLAARLRRDLERSAGPQLDAVIDTFLQDRPQQVVGRALRHDWLVSLGNRARWDWLVPRTADATDPVLICDRLQGRLSLADTAQLGADALAVWSQPVRPPRECDGVFAWLRAQHLITPAAAESRMRAALAANNPRLARDFVADVPDPSQGPLLQWAHLLEAPGQALADLAAHPDIAVEPEAMAISFTRLARTDNRTAMAVLPKLLARPQLTAQLRARLQRAAALGAAYDHDAAALPAFRALPKEAVDDDVYEWRIRAALWAGDFDMALAWINQLPESLSSQPRWRYWRGRLTQMQLGADAAEPIYRTVAGARDYYGYLAADRLHSHYNFNEHPTEDDAAAQRTLASAPGMVRAHELFECDQWDDAVAEWTAVLADAQSATKVQAAHLATRWGWYTQAIVTLVQAGEWDDLALRFPRPYPDQVQKASAATDLPGDWIYAVMRQESLFRHDATSRADARGLMQLQPATALGVARRAGMPIPSGSGLYDPNIGIALGAAYLKELYGRYRGELAVMFAAYNAGPFAVARWMPHAPIEADIWVENIPYNETRIYVQRVLEHIEAYSRDHADPSPRLSEWLTPIDAGTASAAGAGDPPTSH